MSVWVFSPKKLGISSYRTAILVTKATYLSPNGCTTVLCVPLEDAISQGEDRALPDGFPFAFPQLQAALSLSNSFHGLRSSMGTSSNLHRVSEMSVHCAATMVHEAFGVPLMLDMLGGVAMRSSSWHWKSPGGIFWVFAGAGTCCHVG